MIFFKYCGYSISSSSSSLVLFTLKKQYFNSDQFSFEKVAYGFAHPGVFQCRHISIQPSGTCLEWMARTSI